MRRPSVLVLVLALVAGVAGLAGGVWWFSVRPAQLMQQAADRIVAGLASGVWSDLDALASQWRAERRFLPTLPRERAEELMAHWEHAVRQTTLAP